MLHRVAPLAVAVLVSSSLSPAIAQDVEAGKTSFNKCLACHAIGPDAKNKVGPQLNGLDGRKAGAVDNYKYSDANKNADIVWNAETFKEYIANPKAKIPGTRMTFAGLKREKEVADLWAYIAQFDANGAVKAK